MGKAADHLLNFSSSVETIQLFTLEEAMTAMRTALAAVLGVSALAGQEPKLLNPSCQEQNDYDDEQETDAAARVISPAAAVRPSRQGAE